MSKPVPRFSCPSCGNDTFYIRRDEGAKYGVVESKRLAPYLITCAKCNGSVFFEGCASLVDYFKVIEAGET